MFRTENYRGKTRKMIAVGHRKSLCPPWNRVENSPCTSPVTVFRPQQYYYSLCGAVITCELFTPPQFPSNSNCKLSNFVSISKFPFPGSHKKSYPPHCDPRNKNNFAPVFLWLFRQNTAVCTCLFVRSLCTTRPGLQLFHFVSSRSQNMKLFASTRILAITYGKGLLSRNVRPPKSPHFSLTIYSFMYQLSWRPNGCANIT